jgi:hypothetical protein
VLCTCSFDNKGFIVFVATNFAVRHRNLPECNLCRNRQARASSIPRSNTMRFKRDGWDRRMYGNDELGL